MHFDKVEKLVATAPEIPGWTIQALEEPRAIDFFLEEKIEALGIHPGECSFSFESDNPDYKGDHCLSSIVYRTAMNTFFYKWLLRPYIIY